MLWVGNWAGSFSENIAVSVGNIPYNKWQHFLPHSIHFVSSRGQVGSPRCPSNVKSFLM
jgi:hypothetical protein